MVSPVKRQKQEEKQGEGREKAGEKLNDLANQAIIQETCRMLHVDKEVPNVK